MFFIYSHFRSECFRARARSVPVRPLLRCRWPSWVGEMLEVFEAGGDYGRAGGLRTVASAFWCGAGCLQCTTPMARLHCAAAQVWCASRRSSRCSPSSAWLCSTSWAWCSTSGCCSCSSSCGLWLRDFLHAALEYGRLAPLCGGRCAGTGARHLVAPLAARAALWPQARADRGGLHFRRHLSLCSNSECA